jgi:phospholipase C
VHDPAIDRFAVSASAEPRLSDAQMVALLQKKVKYVFVIYQENRSFDSYFGTFPGVDGLFSQPASQTPGFNQLLVNTDGSTTTIQPFRIGPAQYAADTDDLDHSHPRLVAKMDLVNGVPQMDRFAYTEELKYSPTGNPSLQAKQMGELAMAYEDGDTIPFLWQYANRFVLFDHIYQEITGPSTPGNLAIISAQNGTTQWMRHPNEAYSGNGGSGTGVPVLNDDDPFWGSPSDPNSASNKLPVNPGDYPGYTTELNLTYASLPLTLAGKTLDKVAKSDRDPVDDLADVADDVVDIAAGGKTAVPWGWYEEGFDLEPTDPTTTTNAKAVKQPVDFDDDDSLDADSGTHVSYVTHHNGPQYFGYIGNNPKMTANLHGLNDFFNAVDNATLPASGGVFYVKGGYDNIIGLTPADPDAKVQANFLGDDDHPAYSDAQISEAYVATAINKIAQSKYWNNCAIIITWDDSEGDYDHSQPTILNVGPDGSPISDGPRVPLLLISPFAKAHAIDHQQGDHASVVKFVDTVFGLKPLAQLPDELAGRKAGETMGLANEGPFDAITPNISDLTSAFDPARLAGKARLLPAWYVEIPQSLIDTLPQQSGYGWRQVGVVPTDYAQGIVNQIPSDFNPRPKTDPTPAP